MSFNRLQHLFDGMHRPDFVASMLVERAKRSAVSEIASLPESIRNDVGIDAMMARPDIRIDSWSYPATLSKHQNN